jgi:hypothetical protein
VFISLEVVENLGSNGPERYLRGHKGQCT